MISTIKGVWRCVTPQVEPLQRSSQCLSVINNTAYVFGGELQPREPRDNSVYAIALDSGGSAVTERVIPINTSDAPVPRVGAASTRVGNKLYCFGGRGGVSMACLESNGSLDVFNTAGAPSWSIIKPAQAATVDSFPEDRSYHSMTSDNEKTVYVHAGCPVKGRLSDLWAFDISTRQWRQLAPAPGSGRGGTSIAYSSNGKLYRINGFDGKSEQGGAVDVYDPAQNKWSSIEYKPDGVNGPEPRSVSVFVPIKINDGRELLVTMFGEGQPSDLGHAGAGRMFDDAWAFDVSSERWYRVEFQGQDKMPQPRGWFDGDVWTAAGAKGDKIIIHGGLHGNNARLGDVWALEFP